MAVESRFVVIRNGVEVETFMDKKAADEYDKMLDMADNLSVLFEQSSLTLDEQDVENISVFLAKNRDDVLVALQAKKSKPVAVTAPAKATKTTEDKVNVKTAEPVQEPQKNSKAVTKTKAKSVTKAKK